MVHKLDIFVPPTPSAHEGSGVKGILNVMLYGISVAGQEGVEGGGKLPQVVEHLQGHAHLGGVL